LRAIERGEILTFLAHNRVEMGFLVTNEADDSG
jgi:hypothetical protein